MINLNQLQTHVINPALKKIGMLSPEASDLILYTGVQESRYEYVKQIGTGPALGFWQMEPATAEDIYKNYLAFREDLKFTVNQMLGQGPIYEQMIWNLHFAVAMCRLKYRRNKMLLPEVGDGPGMAHIWKQVYNTPLGSGSEEEFIRNWEKYKPVEAV